MDFDLPVPDEGVGPIEVPKDKASEDSLGSLHGLVSTYLTLKIATGKVTSAELGVAVAFLKNNSITCSPAQNEALGALSQALQKKRDGKGALTRTVMKEAEQAFASFAGMALPGMQ